MQNPSALLCILLSNAVPYWATLFSTELPIIMWASFELAHPNWAKVHPIELRWTLLSYSEPYWATLYPTELRCSLLSYASLCELHYSLNWATFHTRTFVQFCQMPECRTIRYRNKGTPVRYRYATLPDGKLDAGIPMPAASALMPMPSSAKNHPRLSS